MNYIIVDLEMNIIAKERDTKDSTHKEIIEIGAVMLDDGYNEIDSFMTYVKPELNNEIESRYASLTGITTSMVKDAPVFKTAIGMFADWCAGRGDDFILYQWSDNDRMQILGEMKMKNHNPVGNEKKIIDSWVDFQNEFSRILGLPGPVALERAVDYAGESFEGRQHDALNDARNTAALFIRSRDEEKFREEMKYVLEAINSDDDGEISLGDMFDFESLKEQL